MRSVLGVLLAGLGGVVIAFGAFGLATTIHLGPRSFGATAIQTAPPAAVGVLLIYAGAAVARWSNRSLVLGIVAVVTGTPADHSAFAVPLVDQTTGTVFDRDLITLDLVERDTDGHLVEALGPPGRGLVPAVDLIRKGRYEAHLELGRIVNQRAAKG